MNSSKNQILNGSPRTEKTYSVVRKALEIVGPELNHQLFIRNRYIPAIYRGEVNLILYIPSIVLV